MIEPMEWIDYGKSFQEFRAEGLLIPMTVIILEGNESAYCPTGPQLVGTVNVRGGLCDDCPIDRDAIVVRYAVLASWDSLLSEFGSS